METKGCFANCSFNKAFILSEEHLKTIEGIIHQRYPDVDIIYKISKSNSFIYHTKDLNELLSEENSKTSSINKLEIIFSKDDTINSKVCFERGEETLIKLEGSNRDTVYLLYNELKTYIDKEVAVARFLHVSEKTSVLMLMSGVMIFLLFSMLFMFSDAYKFGSERLLKLEEILKSNDQLLKLNFLLEQYNSSSLEDLRFFSSPFFIFVLVIIATLIVMFPSIINFLFGKKGVFCIGDMFLIGKEKAVYEKKVKTKSNVIWSIGIGSVVSIVAGLFVYFITTK